MSYKARLKNWAVGARHARPSMLKFGDVEIALPENYQLGYSDNLDTTTRQVTLTSVSKNNDYPVKAGDVVLMYEVDEQVIPGEHDLKNIPLEKAFAVLEDGKVRPLGRNVFVDWEDKELVTKGGIILPESHLESKLVEATILAVGEKVDTVQVGDRVLFQRFSGMRVKLGGNTGMLADSEIGVYAVL